MNTSISNFRMPRYMEIPNVGLFLEQTVKYINSYLEPLGCMEITSSMISNYVKKGYIKSPVKKQYDAEQIAYLFFISITKSVLSMDNISRLFDMQKKAYSSSQAYDYFCNELESMLSYIFEHTGIDNISEDQNDKPEVRMLKSTITAAAHIIYLNSCFEELKKEG